MKMKKILIVLILLSILIMPGLVLAEETLVTLGTYSVTGTLSNVLNLLFTILISLAAVFVLIGGFYFVTASGDTEKISTGRHMITYALVGVVIALLARGLVLLVQNIGAGI